VERRSDSMGRRPRIFHPNFMKPFHDIHKHLEQKEHWMQFPEKKFQKFETEFNGWHVDWHKQFTKGINNIEKAMNDLEKKMDDR